MLTGGARCDQDSNEKLQTLMVLRPPLYNYNHNNSFSKANKTRNTKTNQCHAPMEPVN